MKKCKYFLPGGYIPNTTVTDIADINTRRSRWWNPFSWGLGNDVRDLAARGFTYQDDEGNLQRVEANGMKEDELRDRVKEAKRKELLARKYGSSHIDMSNWSDDQKNLYNTRINSNSGVIKLTDNKTSTPSTVTTPTNNYFKYSFTKNEYSPAYAKTLKALYDNGKYDILSAMVDKGVITDKGLQDYLTKEFNGDFNLFLTNLLQNGGLTQALYDTLGLPSKSIHPSSLTALSATLNWNNNGWVSGINNGNRAKAVQTAFGVKSDGIWGSNTQNALNGKTFSDNDFYKDYYIFKDTDGNSYYAGANGRVYDSKGQEVNHSYKNGQHTITSSVNFNKKGGAMKYFQTGGAINRQQVNRDTNAQLREVLKAAFTAAASGDMESLSKVLGITTQEQLNQFINIATKISKQKDADPEMAELAGKALNGLQQAMSVKAEKGAKLLYFQRLNGKCPEGYEMKMFKVGGRICKKCQKIEEACGGKKLEEGGESPIVTKFKNGRKCKK